MIGVSKTHKTTILYPEGGISRSEISSWNARFCCGNAQEEGIDDIGFLSALIDQMKDQYNVSKVLVTGFSNGGMLAHVAGVELADKIDMIAPVGATVGREILDHKPSRPIDVLMIHGTEDRLVPYASRENSEFLPAREAEEYWARVNGCSEMKEEDLPDRIVHRYSGPEGGCKVTTVLVKGAGHVWPGGKVRHHGEQDPKTVNATDLILEHFLGKEED